LTWSPRAVASALSVGAQRRFRTTSSRSACCPTCRACTRTSRARAPWPRRAGGRGLRHREARLQGRDHLGRPPEQADVGSAIARQWYDTDKVDVIVDVPNSGVALAVNQITKEKGKVFLATGRRRPT
jgi:hypothetical protein